MAVEDVFESGSRRSVLYLTSGSGRLAEHTLDALPEITCETSVRVAGLRLGPMILATGLDIAGRTASTCSSTDAHRTVLIMVTFPSYGLPAAVTPQFMSGAVF